MSRTKYDCKYYEKAKNKAIEDHMLKGILITTDPRAKENGEKKDPEPLEIHETDVEKAKQSFVQCHLSRGKDPEKIRCKIPSKYFISKTYGQVIRIEKRSGKAYWIKPEYYFADEDSRLKVKMNIKKNEYNVPVAGLYGIVFGSTITEKAKFYLRKNPLGSFVRNGDPKKKEGVQAHHPRGYDNTKEPEGIYDENEIVITTKKFHVNYITSVVTRIETILKRVGDARNLTDEEKDKLLLEFQNAVEKESPNKIVVFTSKDKGYYLETDHLAFPVDTKEKEQLFYTAIKKPENQKMIDDFAKTLKVGTYPDVSIKVDHQPVNICIIKTE